MGVVANMDLDLVANIADVAFRRCLFEEGLLIGIRERLFVLRAQEVLQWRTSGAGLKKFSNGELLDPVVPT